MNRSKSLRRKLVIISLITTGLTLLVSNLAYMSLELYMSKRDHQEKLVLLGEILSERTSTALAFSDSALLDDQLGTLQTEASIVRGCIYNNDHKIVAAYQSISAIGLPCPEIAPQSLSATTNLEIFKPTLRNFPISYDDRQLGTLFLESSDEMMLFRFKQYLLFSSVIFLGAFFLALVLANRLKNVVTRPIRDLNETLRTIVLDKDYSIRASKANHDELGDMVDLFNGLLTTIEAENMSLKTSEERFRKLTALSPVGIFQVDPNQELVYVNQRWRDIHHNDTEIPDLQDWFAMVDEQDIVAVQDAWNRLVYDQESVALELRLNTLNGESSWVHLMASTLHDRDGDLLGYLGAIADISELKTAQLQMEHLAFYDPLTGLANRRLFKNRLEKSVKSVMRTGKSMALMFLDMDQFKRINDTLGHDAGDILLKEVAKRLSETVRENDTVSRIGGDEFTILLTDVQQTQDVLVVAEKILEALAQPIRIKGQDIITTVSIGITLTPDDSTDVNTLMKNADVAMYWAKEQGRNNFQFFSEDMNHSILEHLALEKEISEAIEQEQFSLLFQPKVSLFNHVTTGFEALIRWHHPDKGLITPDQFIPVAEETGQIVAIGRWVLEQSCSQIATLQEQNLLPANYKVAVNLSAKQFNDPSLVSHIREIIKQTGIPAYCLELEITESTLMEDVENAINIMQEIKSTGVHIAIDDFGTGYSSLAYIKRFPIDVLKVDRSFVKDIPEDRNDMAITAAVIAMAHKLSLKVIAEGVETYDQLSFLRQNNCDEGQGYFFSRPLSLGQLEQFLIENRETEHVVSYA